MATNAKGKRKVKGKTLNLNTFLGEDHEAPSGFAVVQPRARLDWADTMDNEEMDDRFTLDYKKEEKVVLPTAPKAARGPDVDVAKIPSCPPYTAFLGNLPYDIVDDDIVRFFHNLQVKNVRLPRENGDKGRIRGFGYAEFNNKQDLIEALSMNSETLKNRAIKVSLAGEHDGERGGDRRDAGPDRTLGDWRSDRTSRDEPSRNDSYQSRGFSDRDSFRGRSNYDRPFERNEANDFSSRSGGDRDYGREDRYERRTNDRGYGFSDRGMSRGGGRNERRDGGGFREGSGGFGGRRDDRDTRYSSEREPPRESFERRSADRPSYDSGNGNRERRKLQLAPRTKPIEPVPPPSEAIGTSSIFGGAKPVDTAAREREIEERLAKEKDIVVPKDRGETEARVRKFSSGSGMSNRSRRSSDSGPPGSLRDEEESAPQHKPPAPRQLERDSQSYNTVPRASRQRCESIDSNNSDKDGCKANNSHNRKENYNNNYQARSDNSNDELPNDENSYSEPAKGGFKSVRHHGHRENSRERALHGTTFEEPKAPVYTSANKFSHLLNETDDADRGSTSE